MPPEASLAPEVDRQRIGRLAAAIWAAIAFFGALATVRPLRFPDVDLTAMRMVVISATVIAGVTFTLPWGRMPKAVFNGLLILMAVYITALAYASGAVHNVFMLLLTLAIALAVSFLPVKASVAQVLMIAVLLTAGLVLLDKEDAGIEALRMSLLLAMLVVLCGLVLILRAVIAQREVLTGGRLYQAGLLDGRDLERALEREVSRSGRHARPLSVVMIEITGEVEHQREGDEEGRERIVTAVARSILGRIRPEDSAAYLGDLHFAIIAPETTAAGAAQVAETISDVVAERLFTLGYESGSFGIAVGSGDFPHHARSRSELMAVAQANLRSAAVRNELRREPSDRGTAPAARPAPAGPSSS